MTKVLANNQIEDVVSSYLLGESGPSLASRMGVSQPAIYGLLLRRGIDRRTSSEVAVRCSINHEVFDLLSDEALYWMGFIVTDGCVSRTKYSYYLTIGLKNTDDTHLEKFLRFAGSSHKISYGEGISPRTGNRTKWCRISVTSSRLCQRVLELGRYDKTISPELTSSRHFWRGVMDGDGSWGIYRDNRLADRRLNPEFSVVGRIELMTEFKRYINANGIEGLKVRPKSSVYVVGTKGSKAVNLAELLYRDSSVGLDRKVRLVSDILNMSSMFPVQSRFYDSI